MNIKSALFALLLGPLAAHADSYTLPSPSNVIGAVRAHADSYTLPSTSNEAVIGTVRETFTAPSDSVLQDWTFYLGVAGDRSMASADFHRMAWNQATDRTEGPILYQRTEENAVGTAGLHAFTVDPNVPLTPGDSHVTLLYNPSRTSSSDYVTAYNLCGTTSPLGGSVVGTDQDPTNPNSSWEIGASHVNLAFLADFGARSNGCSGGVASVPDNASTLSLLGLSLFGICVASRANRFSSLAKI